MQFKQAYTKSKLWGRWMGDEKQEKWGSAYREEQLSLV